MQFGLIVRAYAPFKTFGLGFHGDNRPPTTLANTTSRMKIWVDFDPVAGKIGKPGGKCDESSWIYGSAETALPTVRVGSVKLGQGWMTFRLDGAAKNPKPPVSADIDVHLSLTATVKDGYLGLNGSLSGDAFPSCEVIIQDAAETRKMMLSFETGGGKQTGPYVYLPANNTRPMASICTAFQIDKNGLFL